MLVDKSLQALTCPQFEPKNGLVLNKDKDGIIVSD